ncbi:probable SUC2 - invertase (sucrose hydrolyzing enzyme) [Melanopsichium pennsylvanicum]|uniref:Probable SUC2 - invertase (Sucrose hydrolyzing enzyme) n=2 Tax=Melanopsichium pennsylvanicum TaxID=63383 RepID=A0AAJ4XHW5_9BASI|nr:probable SUC2-invertase (sucrose hydrolyzing enzyme) [Melanopsichium pennsylvanicum 4]SNX82899.1 probable SUC2 - invertase (sucrose hydrolyzing enzyme) [Melanopsichium pennsylvanicum]
MKTSFVSIVLAALAAACVCAVPSPTNSFGLPQAEHLFPRMDSGQYDSSNDKHQCCNSNGSALSGYQPPLYTEPVRPQIHFSPTVNFMNDPNGLVYSNGTWHLFFQYNPTENVAGNQHWGHAISTDLYHWKNLPIAIAPENEGDGIFSGNAVIDFENTTGFFNESTPKDQRIVAMYTLNTPTSQTQHLAYSSDGVHFTKYPDAVISRNQTQFRDPKVFWDDKSSRWIVALALSQEFGIVFYASSNLKDWTEVSRFQSYGVLGYQYECPDLFQVPVEGGPDDGKMMYVLAISINPGAPMGGSFVQYWVGDWDGSNFTPRDQAVRTMDFSKDFYAFSSWSNSPGKKAYAIAWANNWQYSQVVPTSPFRSIQSLPRELTLKYYRSTPQFGDLILNNRPVELSALSSQTLYRHQNHHNSGNKTVQLEGNGAFDIQATFKLPANTNITYSTIGSFEIFSGDGKQSVKTGIQMGEPTFAFIDRRGAGESFAATNPFFTDKTSGIIRYAANYTSGANGSTDQYILGPLPASEYLDNSDQDKYMTLQAVVDRSVIEVFVNGGELAGTSVFYFDNDQIPSKVLVSIGDNKLQITNLEVKALDSIWTDCKH